jgi:hypothetical protein
MLIPFPMNDLEKRPYESGAPGPGRVVSGTPSFRTWTFAETPDGKTFSGIWEATTGTWAIHYDEWEYCAILAGESVVTPLGGRPQILRRGDHFVIEPGFSGTWQVVETTRKSFVIRLP